MIDLTGQTIGPYTLVGEVGRGGTATVYRARRESDGEVVALKLLLAELAGDVDFKHRFSREARILTQLQHPHILPVLDFGEEGRYVYFVMRLIEGGTLDTEMSAGPLSLNRAAHLLSQIASALHYAHSHDIIHRDLKPENVLLDASGSALLTDFGLAKILAGNTHMTASGMLMGTPAYMAPEQWRSEPVTVRTDVYALGMLLYEMLVGLAPFEGDTAFALMYDHLDKAPASPSSYHPSLPGAIDAVIYRAIAKEPRERYPSAKAFADAFVAMVKHAPNPDFRPSRPLRRQPPREKGLQRDIDESTFELPTVHPEQLPAWARQIQGAPGTSTPVGRPTPPVKRQPPADSAATTPAPPTPSRPQPAVPRPSTPPESKPASEAPQAVTPSQIKPPSEQRRTRGYRAGMLVLGLVGVLTFVGVIIFALLLLGGDDDSGGSSPGGTATRAGAVSSPTAETPAAHTATPEITPTDQTATAPAETATRESVIVIFGTVTPDPRTQTAVPVTESVTETITTGAATSGVSSATEQATATRTPSPEATQPPTDTPTRTPSNTATRTPTPVAPPTATGGSSAIVIYRTETPPTATDTPSATDTPPATAVATAVAAAPTHSATPRATRAPATATRTAAAVSPTSAVMILDTPAPTRTPTETLTETPTETPTHTATSTPPPTETPTAPPTATPSATATETPVPSATPSDTATYTPTPSATATETPTHTLTPSHTPTEPPTHTPTATPDRLGTMGAIANAQMTRTAAAVTQPPTAIPASATPELSLCFAVAQTDIAVNVRSGPGAGFAVVERLSPGAYKPVLLRTDTGYAYIYAGWVDETVLEFTPSDLCRRVPVISAINPDPGAVCRVQAARDFSDLRVEPDMRSSRAYLVQRGTPLAVYRVVIGADGDAWYYAATDDTTLHIGWMPAMHARDLTGCPAPEGDIPTALLVPTPGPAPADGVAEATVETTAPDLPECYAEPTTSAPLNVRYGPGVGFGVADQLLPNNRYPARMQTDTGFIYVYTGWVDSDYVRLTPSSACRELPMLAEGNVTAGSLCTIVAAQAPSDLRAEPNPNAGRIYLVTDGVTLSVYRVVTGSDGQLWYYAGTNDDNFWFGWMPEAHANPISVCPPPEAE